MFSVVLRGVNVKKTILFTRRDRSMNGEGRRLAGACRLFYIHKGAFNNENTTRT